MVILKITKYISLLAMYIFHFTYAQSDTSKTNGVISFSVSQMPQYKGGEKCLLRFIKGKINYNSISEIEREQIVFVSCIVDTLGNTSSHVVLNKVREDLAREALRIARLIKFEVPAKQGEKSVEVQYFIPVKFLPR